MNRRRMLIILLLCVLKTSGQSEELTDEDYENNSYDDFESSKGTSSESLAPITVPTIEISTKPAIQVIEPSTLSSTTYITVASIETTTSGSVYDSNPSNCPLNCKCSDTFDLVDCSHQHLVQIPKNLPINIVQLNLSHNSLATLNVSELTDCSELRQLFLNDNQIETIVNTDAFAKLPSLHHIDLSSNSLRALRGKEFSKARGLATLLLASNPNLIDDDVAIVQTAKLKTLSLANCSITQLSENIFQNLSSLIALDLDGNPLETALNVKAFKYLVNLRTLTIPKLSSDVASDLCKSLESIDIVHITSIKYDLSCFILTSGSTYEESIIRIGQTTLSTADVESNELYKTAKPKPAKATTTKPRVLLPYTEPNDSAIEEPRVPSSGQNIDTISQNESRNISSMNESDTSGQPGLDDTTTAKVNVSQDVIYMLLIGLIAVTLAALLIGIWCRLDVCGIKTRCCRRSQNRAATEDRVQPHEEIPLNKV